MQDLFHMKLCTKRVHFCILKQFLSKCLLLHSCWCHFLKALANEDTLLRTHCCRHKSFPVCPRGQHLLRTQILYPGHKKCFWFCSETFCGRSKCFPVCAAQERSWATMCPQQCVLVYQGLKDVRAHCYCASLLRTLFIKPRMCHVIFKRTHWVENSTKPRADDLGVNLVCQYFCWMLGEPHFFFGRSLPFLILSIILKNKKNLCVT